MNKNELLSLHCRWSFIDTGVLYTQGRANSIQYQWPKDIPECNSYLPLRVSCQDMVILRLIFCLRIDKPGMTLWVADRIKREYLSIIVTSTVHLWVKVALLFSVLEYHSCSQIGFATSQASVQPTLRSSWSHVVIDSCSASVIHLASTLHVLTAMVVRSTKRTLHSVSCL